MQKEKIMRVLKWLMPKIVKDIQKFLGLVNYYKYFVKDFAKIVKPLCRLVRKDKKWSQGKEQERAFKQLKKVFIIQPVLVVPNLDREMQVGADASEYATEGVLCHNLAKWLSHYLIFLFLFFSFLLLLRWSTGKYHMTSHRVTKCVMIVTEWSCYTWSHKSQ